MTAEVCSEPWCDSQMPEWLKSRLSDRSRVEAFSIRGHRAVVLRTRMEKVAGHWRPVWIAEMYINNPYQLGPVTRDASGAPGEVKQAFARWSENYDVRRQPEPRNG